MISTYPLKKKLVHNFEVFSFKAWYQITLDPYYTMWVLHFIFQMRFCSCCNKSWSTILHIMVSILFFSFMNRFEHIPTRLNFDLLKKLFFLILVSTKWFIIESLNKYNIVKLLLGFLKFCTVLNQLNMCYFIWIKDLNKLNGKRTENWLEN